MSKHLTHPGVIANKILILRGHKVMFDRDLAELYEVKAIALRQQVKRNMERFPADFMFQLNEKELEIMLSQNVIPSRKFLGGFLPYVFTEQGVAMLSSVLKSKRAVLVNIQIMRVFTKLREMILSHEDLQKKIDEMERKYDSQFKAVFDALRKLLERPGEEHSTVKGFIGSSNS